MAVRRLGLGRWLGKALRAPLRLIPATAILPILQGPGRGLRWIVGSYNHSCWLGSYEQEKQIALRDLVGPGDVVYDVGAHVGYFTIILARLVCPNGVVYSFEPFEENFGYLLKHLRLNGITNVVAVRGAIGPVTGMGHLQPGPHSAMGRLGGDTGTTCPVYNLVEYIAANKLRPPSLIKMDIEGEEARVVPSIIGYFGPQKVKLLISTHSDEITTSLVRLLSARGYQVTPLQWANNPSVRRAENATLILGNA